jgi:hypothetical protein
MPLKAYSHELGVTSIARTQPTLNETIGADLEVPEAFANKHLSEVEATRFDPKNPPPVEPWVFKLAGVEIAHPGNILTAAGAIKAAKSSVLSAIASSTIGAADRDYLGFEGRNPNCKAVLHFDTEQSRGDHFQMMMRALHRAGIDTPPTWFSSYSLILLGPCERRAVICAMARKAAATSGLHSIFIDGVADLVFDVNDATEACGLVAELHQLATETGCVIITALHHNPGGEKTRGHLGSQIERKSESVLVLRKDGETVSISCKPARRQEISGDQAPRFAWNADADMHLLTESKATAADGRKRIELGTLADEAFGDKEQLRWVELNDFIMKTRGWSTNTAGSKITAMVKLGLIIKASDGLYMKGQP